MRVPAQIPVTASRAFDEMTEPLMRKRPILSLQSTLPTLVLTCVS